MNDAELLAIIAQAEREGWTELDLSGKNLSELPVEIERLTQLESLILGKGLEGYEIVGDRALQRVSGNDFKTLPIELLNLHNLRKLDISANPLGHIPDVVTQMLHLEELILIRVELTEIPDAIAQLSNLTTLDLSSNQITTIPEAIAQLSNLTTLSLSYNQITVIPDEIANLVNLTILDLFNNQISKIPDTIIKLANLATLDLSSNQIEELPSVVVNLASLTTLSLSSNQIKEIPDEIHLSHLTTLNLFNNQIKEIPEAISRLANLTTLDLSSNQIKEIPDAINKLTNLITLFLFNNQIKAIPAEIASLANLTSLSLFNNQVKTISDEIGNLANLTSLNLHSNQIKEIPDAINKLTNLTTLDLSNNQIKEIPHAINKLTNLITLDLSDNQIMEIPEEIASLANLTTLFLFNNQIKKIPDGISRLTNLTTLFLYNNQIKEIPDAIDKLTNLTTLLLNNNQIKEIPDAISRLINLTTLSLHNNYIKEIPFAIESLLNLKELDLRRNPLPISPEILGAPSQVGEIFNYLCQLRSTEVRPLNEAKLILVGQGSVGKTSLMERLIRDQYDKNQAQTDGLNVETWNVEVNSKDIRLNAWDFGGQEIYHATHQFFLTKRSLYLLVCNCRTSEEENRIEYWLKLIESFGGKSPVIIVGNKKDEQPLDINRKALREKYPNIRAIIETSCQDNIGIDELRAAILKEVSNLKEVYDLLPLSWFEVKQQLESMPEDFITYNRYVGICHENKIPDEQNQEQLIDLLHRLGLVLNFRDHPILKDTNVLKPNWVTEGIYALLSDEDLKTKTKGIFTPADLTRILDPERYPPKRHTYLIELMKEFELGFELACHPPQFLIAGLLPKDQPEETGLEGETLEFQYHYKILPESIISRFIVITHDRIYNQTYWRSGVMLQYQENNETYNVARIKADPEDKKIFIAISGRKETRRLFLGILRDTFKRIHNTLPNLEITEWVPVPHYPDHLPLDYQELIALEAMGETNITLGKLRLKLDLRGLLDGYEQITSRQRQIPNYEDFSIRDIIGGMSSTEIQALFEE